MLYRVEDVLSAPLAELRSRRCRGVNSLSMNTQYVSYRRRAAWRSGPGAPAVVHQPLESPTVVKQRLFIHQRGSANGTKGALVPLANASVGGPWVLFAVFNDATSATLFEELDAGMALPTPPVSVCIDDQTSSPTAAQLAFLGARMRAFFERHWPDRAPWER